jgi:hypothetical protein
VREAPLQQWVIEVVYDPATNLVQVRSRGGIPDVDTGVRMLRDALNLAEKQAASVGKGGIVGPSGVPLVREGLTS